MSSLSKVRPLASSRVGIRVQVVCPGHIQSMITLDTRDQRFPSIQPIILFTGVVNHVKTPGSCKRSTLCKHFPRCYFIHSNPRKSVLSPSSALYR